MANKKSVTTTSSHVIGPANFGPASISSSGLSNQTIPNIKYKDGITQITGELVVGSGNNQINVVDLLQSVSERLCILQPNFEAMQEYPALRDAYDQYKMLEQLLIQKNKKVDQTV